MYTLIAVVCTSATCVSWAAPEIFSSAEECDAGIHKLHEITSDADVYEVMDVYCYQWSSGV